MNVIKRLFEGRVAFGCGRHALGPLVSGGGIAADGDDGRRGRQRRCRGLYQSRSSLVRASRCSIEVLLCRGLVFQPRIIIFRGNFVFQHLLANASSS